MKTSRLTARRPCPSLPALHNFRPRRFRSALTGPGEGAGPEPFSRPPPLFAGAGSPGPRRAGYKGGGRSCEGDLSPSRGPPWRRRRTFPHLLSLRQAGAARSLARPPAGHQTVRRRQREPHGKRRRRAPRPGPAPACSAGGGPGAPSPPPPAAPPAHTHFSGRAPLGSPSAPGAHAFPPAGRCRRRGGAPLPRREGAHCPLPRGCRRGPGGFGGAGGSSPPPPPRAGCGQVVLGAGPRARSPRPGCGCPGGSGAPPRPLTWSRRLAAPRCPPGRSLRRRRPGGEWLGPRPPSRSPSHAPRAPPGPCSSGGRGAGGEGGGGSR